MQKRMTQSGISNLVSVGQQALVTVLEERLGATVLIGDQNLITGEVGVEGFVHADHDAVIEEVG